MRRPVSERDAVYVPKLSTCSKAVATEQRRNFSQQKLTVGLDLGDRTSTTAYWRKTDKSSRSSA